MSRIINIEAKAQLQWRAQKSRFSSRWIGVCDPMNISVEAETLDELFSVIDETIQVVFLDLFRDNELEIFLRDHGWSRSDHILREDVSDDVQFNVPWGLIAEGHARDSERRTN